MKIVVYNLGCKVNQYESDAMLKRFEEAGYEVSEELEYADVYVLNTCAVTNEAEKKSRQVVARVRKLNKDAKIIVCGCASQNNAEQFESKDGVTYVSGVAAKAKIPDMLSCKGVEIEPLPAVYEDNLIASQVRTRAYVKVQDGCNNFCSYCLIPYLRGRSRSRSIDSVARECDSLRGKARELVITGINLSAYGKDTGSSLEELLRSLQSAEARIRLGSLEANVIDESFLDATGGLKAFCPQFHLSLQSGDDGVLKDMNRHYTTDEYYSKVMLIRKYYPNAAITTDLICGYPTESDVRFDRTLEFIDKVAFSDMHIFAYSRREGTRAAKLPLIDSKTVKTRCERAEEICRKNRSAYLNSLIGKPLEVLIEEDGSGYSREYARVYSAGNEGKLKTVTPTELYNDGLR